MNTDRPASTVAGFFVVLTVALPFSPLPAFIVPFGKQIEATGLNFHDLAV